MKKIINNFFAPILDQNQDKIEQCKKATILKKGARYFDFTASGLAFAPIQKRLASFLPYYANTHSDTSEHATITTALYKYSKEVIKECLGLSEEFSLLNVGSGSTGAIKLFQELLGIYIPPKTKEILGIREMKNLPYVFVGAYEHHSNEISYREGLCHLQRISLNAKGLLNIEELQESVHKTQGKIIGSFNVASNVTGIITPYEEISKILRNKDAIIAFDMASSSPYMNVPSTLFDACFLSPHKLLGGVGSCGLLGIKTQLIDTSLPPTFGGGGTIRNANRTTHEYLENIDYRQEAGTPGIIQLLTAALAYQLRNEIGLDLIHQREKVLVEVMMHELKSIPALTLYGNSEVDRLGVFSFNIGGISPFDLALELSQKYGIQTRSGCSCAGPYGYDLFGLEDSASEMGIKPSWIRASVHYTHSIEDIEYFISSLKKAIKKLRV
ncbi:aminotransferase class V-fold PLP-dependent enzyme [Helicobacter cholecystus]|uniref:Aminotransferase class V-fold PLP-dependent enzyme n=1 Tax=Helicobacter cholecystus TaxID=45498 RepID=A0A3D8IWP0_9HELI|nr:aminotransferase class V-fold PLP-dependent enzyme [Helicobacter cholecystus]RDU69662.1 aminotransferase class V-fold PLP-dependent enzyme [Helicobacter cholecystus]VEJ24225.1 putative aminotransferase [Helicobacter cholecystus]